MVLLHDNNNNFGQYLLIFLSQRVLAVGQNILGKYSGQWYRGRVTARQPKTGKGYTGIYSIKFQHVCLATIRSFFTPIIIHLR